MTADGLHETVNLIRSRSRRSFVALDAGWKRRLSDISHVETLDYAYMRDAETARSITKAYRGASTSAERRGKQHPVESTILIGKAWVATLDAIFRSKKKWMALFASDIRFAPWEIAQNYVMKFCGP
jgi:hypothetical protein